MRAPIETAPVMDLRPPDLDRLVEALRDDHALDSPLLQRREPREWAEQSLHGLRLEMPRQSIAPMVWALDGAPPKAVRARQLFRSEGAWDDQALLTRHGQEGDRELGEADGVLTLDGSDLPTQGHDSVGVKRQDCGDVGTRAHGPAGVSVGDASRTGSTLLERRRYVPQAWGEEATYAARRWRCGVPADLGCKTTPTVGWELIEAVRQAGTLRARGVTGDEAFGRDTRLLDRIDGLGRWSCAAVPHDTQLWRQRPATGVPSGSGQGRNPTRRRVRARAAAPEAVAQLAAALPADRWRRHTLTAGSQGPLVARVAARRVIAGREGLPGPEGWLVRRRKVLTGELQTSLSKAPADTLLTTLGRLSGRRWPIDTCVEDGQQYLGLGEYEVRRGRGWQHHLTLVILAHVFLVRACHR
jgi:SRSO17 transposase